MRTITELQEQLKDEKAKLVRMNDKAEQAAVAAKAAVMALDQLEASIFKRQQEAILDEKPWFNTDAEKELSVAKMASTSAFSTAEAHRAALVNQNDAIAGIEVEIKGRRHEMFRAELKPLKAELLGAMQVMVKAATRIHNVGHAYGIDPQVMSIELFGPLVNPRDLGEGMDERNLQANLVNIALAVQVYWIERNGRPYAAI